MPETHVDDSRWPLVICTAVGEQSAEDFETWLACCDRLLRRLERYVTIFDARRAAPISALLRRRQAQWQTANEEQLRAYLVATSLVMTSPVHRGILRAIMWLKPLPCPYSVEASLIDSRRFVLAHLAASRGGLPPWLGSDEALPGQRQSASDAGTHRDSPRRPML